MKLSRLILLLVSGLLCLNFIATYYILQNQRSNEVSSSYQQLEIIGKQGIQNTDSIKNMKDVLPNINGDTSQLKYNSKDFIQETLENVVETKLEVLDEFSFYTRSIKEPSTERIIPMDENSMNGFIIAPGMDPKSGLSITFMDHFDKYFSQNRKSKEITFGNNKMSLEDILIQESKNIAIDLFPVNLSNNILSQTSISSEEYYTMYPHWNPPDVPSFICMEHLTICQIISGILHRVGLIERTYYFQSLYDINKPMVTLALPWKVWCYLVAGATSKSDCIIAALTRDDSPLGDVFFFNFRIHISKIILKEI